MWPGSIPVLENTKRRTRIDDEGTAAAHMDRMVIMSLRMREERASEKERERERENEFHAVVWANGPETFL